MKRTLLILAILLLALTLLSACGAEKPAEPPAETEASETAPETESPSEPEGSENAVEGGEKFVGNSFSETVGNLTLNTEWIPFEEPLVVDDIFKAFLAVSGDKYYVITDGKVKLFGLKDGSFVFEDELPLSEDYERICTDNNGILYISRFMRDFIAYEDSNQIFAHDGPKKVSMHPSGEWGISWFTGPDVEKLTLDGESINKEPRVFEELGVITSVDISENHIFIGGSSAENKKQAVFVYDLNGNLKATLGDKEHGNPDSLGSITRVIETDNGFMALDGNLRNLCFWEADGSFIGAVKAKNLFGTRYPWLSTAELMPDGSILIGMTEKRADESATEFIVYRMTGF